MYIISKFKDFYDGVAGTTGIDKTIVYERKTISYGENDIEMINEFKFNNLSYSERKENMFNSFMRTQLKSNSPFDMVTPFIVGFCGKLYMGWDFMSIIRDHKCIRHESHYITYNYNEVKDYIVSYPNKLNDVIDYINNYDSINLFRHVNAPIFTLKYNNYNIAQNDQFSVNSKLKDFEFYKIFDSFTAFQEIQMFISGVLGTGENDIIEISNSDKIKKHGFDKFSFRKDPEK